MHKLAYPAGVTKSAAAAILPQRKARLLQHIDILNHRLHFRFTLAQMLGAYRISPDLAWAAPETVHAHVAGIMRLLHLPPEKLSPLLLNHPSLFRRTPASVHATIAGTATVLGISFRAHLTNILKHRRLVNVTPTRATTSIDALASGLTIPRNAVLAMLRSMPHLLTFNTDTLLRNAHQAAEALEIPLGDYVRMAIRMPGLLAHPAATLRTRVDAFSKALDVPVTDAIAAFRRNPPLLAMATETIISNINTGAALLGVQRHVWSRILIKRSVLLAYRPAHIQDTVKALSGIFRTTPDEVIGVALRYPAILAGKPATAAAKIPLVLSVCKALGFDYTPLDTLRECPLAYTYATDRLTTRLTLARNGLGPRSIMNLLSLPEADAQAHMATLTHSTS